MKVIKWLIIFKILLIGTKAGLAIDWHYSYIKVDGNYYKSSNKTSLAVSAELNWILSYKKFKSYHNIQAIYSSLNSDTTFYRISGFTRFQYQPSKWFYFIDILGDDYYGSAFSWRLAGGPGVGVYLFKNERLKVSLGIYGYLVKYFGSEQNFDENINVELRIKLKLIKNLHLKNKSIQRHYFEVNSNEFTSETSFSLSLKEQLSLDTTFEVFISKDLYYRELLLGFKYEF